MECFRLRGELENEQKQNEKLRKKNAELEAGLHQCGSLHKHLKETLAALNIEAGSIRNENKILSCENNVLKEWLSRLQSQQDKLNEESQKIKIHEAVLEHENETLEEKINQSEKRINEVSISTVDVAGKTTRSNIRNIILSKLSDSKKLEELLNYVSIKGYEVHYA